MGKFLTVLAVATAALRGANAMSDPVVLESLPAVPDGWTKVADASYDESFTLRIALRQDDPNKLTDTLLAVSDPSHPQYGQHLDAQQLKEVLKPPTGVTETVIDWMKEAGIPFGDIHDEGDWIVVDTNVGQVNKMLETHLGIYQHDDTVKIRALSYSVPAHVAEYIRMISPIIRFGDPRPMRSTIHHVEKGSPITELFTLPQLQGTSLELEASCNTSITPNCLRALYKVGDTVAVAAPGSLFGVGGFLEQWAKFDMLEKFGTVYAPYINQKLSLSIKNLNGGINPQDNKTQDSQEANLDVQYAVSMSYGIPVTYYSTAGRGPLVPDVDSPDPNDVSNEPYIEFLNELLNLPNEELPQTLSISYGENEQEVPAEYIHKVCEMFASLGLRGVSVLIASGDEGPGVGCETNDGKNTTRFMPVFPASCPYVTSVGGTHYIDPEQAVGFSSGGFSDIWPRPSYQQDAVDAYLKKLGPDKFDGLYNKSGRGFPDVAAQGANFHVFDSGYDSLISGTSASTPLFASIIALLNNDRLANGKPPLGFLNPWLYNNSQILTDITLGGSRGCTGMARFGNRGKYVPYASWNATEGWDPVTGLGTPLFDKMLESIRSTPLYG